MFTAKISTPLPKGFYFGAAEHLIIEKCLFNQQLNEQTFVLSSKVLEISNFTNVKACKHIKFRVIQDELEHLSMDQLEVERNRNEYRNIIILLTNKRGNIS